MKTRNCPVCSGIAEFVGNLGVIKWYRCRDCGIMHKRDKKGKSLPQIIKTKGR